MMKNWNIGLTIGLAVFASLPVSGQVQNGMRMVDQAKCFQLDDLPWQKMGDKFYRKYASGTGATFGYLYLEKGCFIPMHSHPNEQYTHLIEGKVDVTIGDQKFHLKKGDMLMIPANAKHSFEVLEDTIDLDFFAPAREDWHSGKAAYFKQTEPKPIEVVGEFGFRPGNVTVTEDCKVIATVHPLSNPSKQLVQVMPDGSVKDFPDSSWQRANKELVKEGKFDSPLGVVSDQKGRVWVIDMGLNSGVTRLYAFDHQTRRMVYSYEFPQDVAPKGSFIQDLAVDDEHGVVYLADIQKPGLLVLNLKDKKVRRYSSHPSFQAEDVDMMIDGKLVKSGGQPARVGVNPLTISADHDTLYYGAMSGRSWYSISAKQLREGASEGEVYQSILKVADKPISDGCATDGRGNHYFTNLTDKGIDFWKAKTKTLEPLVRDERLSWVDNVALGPDGYLYFVVNQLHLTPAFTGGDDLGNAPYYIYKVKLD